MEGIVSSVRLGWKALFFKEDAYEEMRTAPNPVVKGLIFLIIIGLVIALLNLVGTVLERASIPDLNEIKEIVRSYMPRMPWWQEVVREAPGFEREFQRWYDLGWRVFPRLFGAPNIGGAALGIITKPLQLLLWWLIYGLLAFLFARWLGGTADFSQTLGVLALAAAPQFLNILTLLPFVQVSNLVGVWSVLCAYVSLRTAHKLSWGRAVGATLLPFILAVIVVVLAGCLGSATFASLVKGG